MNIILCGFQGVGKTYFGRLVSQKLKRDFFDSDEQLLEKNKEMPSSSVRDFCLRVGEEEFRKQEAAIVLALCEKKEVIIALGGGSLTNKQSQRAIKKAGRLLYLYLPYEELYKRLQGIPLPSYLSNKKEAFEKLFTERHKVFSQLANETIFLQGLVNDQVLDKICCHHELQDYAKFY